MTFDPFGDYEAAGYLRNFAGEKHPEIVRRLEHNSFLTGIDDAFRRLSGIKRIAYADVLETHKILFEAVYPWAGQDRTQIAPEIAVSKGSILFAHPKDASTAVSYALKMGRGKAVMASKPGEVMGYLAYCHPFLGGYGRHDHGGACGAGAARREQHRLGGDSQAGLSCRVDRRA